MERRGRPAAPLTWDTTRSARLGSFGLLFYGPLMHVWYGFLGAALPGAPPTATLAARFAPFAAKVVLNQLVLGPVVVTAVFAYSLAWANRLPALPAKLRRDALPTLRKGWAFWVPAAGLNFALVPLQHQVLYMSACSVVWTAILSAAAAQ